MSVQRCNGSSIEKVCMWLKGDSNINFSVNRVDSGKDIFFRCYLQCAEINRNYRFTIINIILLLKISTNFDPIYVKFITYEIKIYHKRHDFYCQNLFRTDFWALRSISVQLFSVLLILFSHFSSGQFLLPSNRILIAMQGGCCFTFYKTLYNRIIYLTMIY
jgi:hypothetical protein